MEKLLHERLRELKGATANEIREREQVIHSDELLDKWADEIERYYIPRPRFEDGEPVQIGDEAQIGDLVFTVKGFRIFDGVNDGLLREWNKSYDACFCKRPTPKVYDADGVPCKVGDEGWDIANGQPYEVLDIEHDPQSDNLIKVTDGVSDPKWIIAEKFTHERPLYDAEGVRCIRDEKVWCTTTGAPCKIIEICPTTRMCAVEWLDSDAFDSWLRADRITHHEPDSLEKLYADMRENSDNGKNDDPNTGFGFLTHDNHLDRFRALIDRGAK